MWILGLKGLKGGKNNSKRRGKWVNLMEKMDNDNVNTDQIRCLKC